MVLKKRKLVFSFKEPELVERFTKLLLERGVASKVIVRVRSFRQVEVTVYGTADEVKAACAELKLLRREVLEEYKALSSETARMSLSRLHKLIGGTVPLDALIIALRSVGIECSAVNGDLEFKGEPRRVVELAKAMLKALNDIRFKVRGKAAKKLVGVLSSVLNIEADEAIAIALSEGVLREDEEGKYVLTYEWHMALEKLLKAYGYPVSEA